MKKIISLFLILTVVIVSFLSENIHATSMYKGNPKDIKIEVLSITNKVIKLNLINDTDKKISFPFSIKLQKKTNNGWKTIPFKQGALFPKTLYEIKAHENSPFQCELLLEYFYQVPLASGIYRCTFANPIVFEITENGEGKVLQITSPKMGDIEG